MCCSQSAGSSMPTSGSSIRSPATRPSFTRPPTSSTPTFTGRSRRSETWGGRRRRARARPWWVSSSCCSRTGCSVSRSRRVQSTSLAAPLHVASLLRRQRSRRPRAGNLAVHACLLLLSFLFLVPLILLVSASLSSEADISTYGFSLIPRSIDFAAYQYILNDPTQIVSAYAVTITVTLVATGAGVLIMALLSRPALATVALFCALAYWNDWYLALLFINNPALVPLQYLLYQISTNIAILQTSSQAFGVQIPALSAQMAIAVLAIGPITLAFLAVQKHFVSGITLGGAKGDWGDVEAPRAARLLRSWLAHRGSGPRRGPPR